MFKIVIRKNSNKLMDSGRHMNQADRTKAANGKLITEYYRITSQKRQQTTFDITNDCKLS